MTPPALVLVTPFRQYASKAGQEGFRVCSIWDPSLESPEYLRVVAERSDELILTDFTDRPGLRAVIRDAALRLDARFVHHAGREDTMLLAYEVADELGKAANPPRAVHLLNDKLAMRELLGRHGLSPVRHTHAPAWRAVAPLLDGFEPPVVVKPTSLAGSRGVQLLRRPDELPEWGRLLDGYGYDGPVLVEEFLRGPEFSVETLSAAGVHHVVGVTAKQLGPPPLFVETGHVHPAPVTAARRMAMGELTVRLLRAAGYRNGPAHTEVIWTAAGPRIVESQARVGGDRIFRLVELATGVDIERAMFTVLAGREPDLAPRQHRVARIGYFGFPPGTLESVTGLDLARELPGVADLHFPFAPGDRLPPVVDSKSRHGYAIVSGATHEEAARLLARVHDLVRVRVRPALP